MKLSILFFFILLIFSCASPGEKKQDKIQEALFDTTFNYADVKAIAIVGFNGTHMLDSQQRHVFIEKLKRLKYEGVYKCISKYSVRIVLEKDTFQLRVCGEMCSSRTGNEYYCLPDSEKIIGDFINN